MLLKAQMYLVERSATTAIARNDTARLRNEKIGVVLLWGLLLPVPPFLLDFVGSCILKYSLTPLMEFKMLGLSWTAPAAPGAAGAVGWVRGSVRLVTLSCLSATASLLSPALLKTFTSLLGPALRFDSGPG